MPDIKLIPMKRKKIFKGLKNCLMYFLVLAMSQSIYAVVSKGTGTTQNNFSVNLKQTFTENKGQIVDQSGNSRPDIYFYTSYPGLTVYAREAGISYVYVKYENEVTSPTDAIINSDGFIKRRISSGLRMDMEFLNTPGSNYFEKIGQGKSYNNYYLGHCKNGITGVGAYEHVIQKNIYSKIDVEYIPAATGLKYNLIINPGGDIADIRIRYNGIDNVELINNKLQIQTALGGLEESMPKAYQLIEGAEKPVEVKYILQEGIISFEAKNYNRKYPLIIDPWVTYLGGSDEDRVYDIKTDNNGNVYVVGGTESLNFPISAGAFDDTIIVDLISAMHPDLLATDGYIFKFAPDGTQIWSTYFGGSKLDNIWRIVTDQSNNLYVAGFSWSSDFPTTSGVYYEDAPYNLSVSVSDSGGGTLAKLDENGNRIWATYIEDFTHTFHEGYGLALLNNGNILVAGTTSKDTLPTTIGAFQSYKAKKDSNLEAYIQIFDNNGTVLQYATYFGGTRNEIITSAASDQNGDIVILGSTTSGASNNFPILNAAQSLFGGGATVGIPVFGNIHGDAFLAKLSGDLTTLLWSTYMGNSKDDLPGVVEIDNDNNVYACFMSTPGTLDGKLDSILTNSVQPHNCGNGPVVLYGDGVLIKFREDGQVAWGTFFGDVSSEKFYDLSISKDGSEIYVLGEGAVDKLPKVGHGYDNIASGIFDTANGWGIIICKYDSSGELLCTGGSMGKFSKYDLWGGMDIYENTDGTTNIHFGGHGSMNNADIFATANAFQDTFDMSIEPWEGFVVQVSIDGCEYPLNADFAASNQTLYACVGDTIDFLDISTGNIVNWYWDFGAGDTSIIQNPSYYFGPTADTFVVKLKINTQKWCGYYKEDSITLNIIVSDTPQFELGSDITVCLDSGGATVMGPTNAIRYSWSPIMGVDCDTCAIIAANPDTTTIYKLLVDILGCELSDSLTVFVDSCLIVDSSINFDSTLFFPNVLSLSGQINNLFTVSGDGLKSIDYIKIFNRWGSLVYDSKGVETSWYGKSTITGKNVNPGVYVYSVEGTFVNTSTFIRRGNITVLE